MEEAFLAYLRSQVAVPVYWLRQPILQKAFPYINMAVVSHPTQYALDGETREALIQVDIWAGSFGEAVTTGRAVHAALTGHAAQQGAITFKGIFSEGERDSSESVPDGTGERTLFRRSVDYRVAYAG